MASWTRTLLASVVLAGVTLAVVYLFLTSIRPEAPTSVATGDAEAVSVDDAISSDRGERVAVRGFVFIDANVGELLCSARTNDDPPACAGAALTLTNLDPSRLELVFPERASGNYDAWSRDTVVLLGRVDRTAFTVDDVLASS